MKVYARARATVKKRKNTAPLAECAIKKNKIKTLLEKKIPRDFLHTGVKIRNGKKKQTRRIILRYFPTNVRIRLSV